MARRGLIGLFLGLALLVHARADGMEIGVAGVPKPLGEARDYDALFAGLRAAGVTLFYPTFQFVEAPAPETVGAEVDFIPPCRPDSPAFAAMRRHGVRLIAPSNLLYDAAGPLPPRSRDPLAALIACAGRDTIFGILSFDEPGFSGVGLDRTEALYRRVGEIAPGMPVLMVHGPLVIDPEKHDTEAKRRRYLEEVVAHSRHADIIGFSTYPIPPIVARMGAPGAGGEVVDHRTATRGYMAWLRAALPGKRRMAVLQNFNYADQYAPELLETVAPPALRALVRPPSEAELAEMARESVEGGAEIIVWYGASFAKSAEDAGWRATLAVSRRLNAAR